MQRRVPSSPPYAGAYTISVIRAAGPGLVMLEAVADNLQRVSVTVRSDRSSAEDIDATVRAALGALYRPPDPVR